MWFLETDIPKWLLANHSKILFYMNQVNISKSVKSWKSTKNKMLIINQIKEMGSYIYDHQNPKKAREL